MIIAIAKLANWASVKLHKHAVAEIFLSYLDHWIIDQVLNMSTLSLRVNSIGASDHVIIVNQRLAKASVFV